MGSRKGSKSPQKGPDHTNSINGTSEDQLSELLQKYSHKGEQLTMPTYAITTPNLCDQGEKAQFYLGFSFQNQNHPISPLH